jgi:hypothetical protein
VKAPVISRMKTARLKAAPGEPVPVWDFDRLEKRPCIVCSSPDHEQICVRPDGLSVVRCLQCGCTYLHIVPNDEQLQDYYHQYSESKLYIRHKTAVANPSRLRSALICALKAAKGVAGTSLSNMIRGRLNFPVSDSCEILIRTGGLEGKSVLELGPGRFGGILPEASRWGARGLAVEVDGGAVQSLQGLGIEVVDDISKAPAGIEVVYAGMVLEHLKDPGQVLNELSSKVIAGGRLLIRVPNGGQSRNMGANWIGFRVDLEHLNYFDSGSLSSLLSRAGFQTECVWLTSNPVLPDYLCMADRNCFIDYARTRFNRKIKAKPDVMLEGGEFMLTVLARREH